MAKKKFKLGGKVFFSFKLLLTIISLVLVIVCKSNIDWVNIERNYIDFVLVKEIAYDLSVGVFSAMILVWFIDEIGQRIEWRKSKEKELYTIKRYNKIISLYIDQYIDLFYAVATPIGERDHTRIQMPPDFKMKDMRDLFQTSLILSENLLGSSVESFLRVERDLRDLFINLLVNHDFEHYPRFMEIFSEYTQFSILYDCHDAILSSKNQTAGGIPVRKQIRDILIEGADEYLERAERGEDVNGSLIHPYICLYRMMRQERKYILQYIDEIKKIGLLPPEDEVPNGLPQDS